LSCARLEQLVHLQNSELPPSQRWIEITIPDDIAIEYVDPADLPGWDANDYLVSRKFGDKWLHERRTAVLMVPSVASAGEHVIVINPQHLDFVRISASEERELIWNERLLQRR
jgi:RES domain-containing protein